MPNSYKILEIKTKSDAIAYLYELPQEYYPAFSIELTGQIKTRKELEAFILSCPYADQSKPLNDRLTAWDNHIKAQPSQVLDIHDIKKIIEFNGNGDLRDAVGLVCRVQKQRFAKDENRKIKKREGTPLIYTNVHKQDLKTRYQPSYDISHKKMKEAVTIILDLYNLRSDIEKMIVEKRLRKVLTALFQ